MIQSDTRKIALTFILVASASTLCAQPYTFDESGNGIQYFFFQPRPLPFEVMPDPTGGITTSPVLIYLLGQPVVSGDVALMEPDGSTVADLLRFFTPAGGTTSDVIFYSRADGLTPTLADVGIPYSADSIQISEVRPTTLWAPDLGQPGAGNGVFPVFDVFRYSVTTEVPEPSLVPLLLVATGVWLMAGKSSRNDCYIRKGLPPST